ncbi:hypothetical protein B0A91_05315 [Pseudomonas syringae]|nr:hypothetical protein B1F67_00095 [Pseudomonas syringae]RXU08159.1 hypothetical protein B1F68_07390 [Pseudomonas syringae]RXU16382.1 hypothetical protein BXU05_03965 [Pseudomonas syringae]RXU22026.1 hypothetical protein B1F70_02580 [Pseudomonas syringae]RXU26486.1 hypothetical protein B0A91_05315 [Pseudomonas syringae]
MGASRATLRLLAKRPFRSPQRRRSKRRLREQAHSHKRHEDLSQSCRDSGAPGIKHYKRCPPAPIYCAR